MTDKRRVEDMLAQKEQEIQKLESRLQEARGYARALRELLGIKDKSMADQARDIILARKHPVHITDMLMAMGREISRESRVSLTSALAAYVRRREIFTRPHPNRFGLIELGHHAPPRASAPAAPEPPADFGEIPNLGEILGEALKKKDA